MEPIGLDGLVGPNCVVRRRNESMKGETLEHEDKIFFGKSSSKHVFLPLEQKNGTFKILKVERSRNNEKPIRLCHVSNLRESPEPWKSYDYLYSLFLQ